MRYSISWFLENDGPDQTQDLSPRDSSTGSYVRELAGHEKPATATDQLYLKLSQFHLFFMFQDRG
jgi:hypothetical protein